MGISIGGILTGSPQPVGWSVTESLSKGWSAALDYGSWVNTRFAPEAMVSISIIDHRGVSLVLPRMLASDRGRTHGTTRGTSIQLIDELSWRLGSGGQSWATFLGGTAANIVAAVASRFGVSISGAPSFSIYKEDFKLVTGWNPLQRVMRVAGQVYTISSSNVLELHPWNWVSSGSPFQPSTSGGVKEDYKPLDRLSSVFVTKNLGLGTGSGPQYYDFNTFGRATGELAWPLSFGAFPRDESRVGSVAWVCLWDGPPDTGGRLLSIHSLNGDEIDGITIPVNGVWPATHYSCNVYHSNLNPTLPIEARLKIDGVPHSNLPSGIDGAIGETFGSGRGAPYPFSDSMVPNLAFAAANYPSWLAEANRGTNMMSARGPLDCRVRVGQTWGWPPLGLSGRIEQVRHSGGRGAPSTEILVNCDIAA